MGHACILPLRPGEILTDLNQHLRSRWGSTVTMFAILFGHPSEKIMREQIVPRINYFHFRSGRNFHIYCAGFSPFDRTPIGPFPVDIDSTGGDSARHGDSYSVKVDGEHWSFGDKDFNSARVFFENLSKWKYSGGTDLIISNARLGKSIDAEFDFSTAISLNLEKYTEQSKESVGMFLERLFRYAESEFPYNPTWGFSDSEGKQLVKGGFKDVLISLLPEGVRSSITQAFQLAVCDIGK